MNLNRKKIGILLVGLSLLLFLILILSKTEVDVQEAFLCEAVHSNPTLTMEQCPVHTSNLSWLFVVLFAISALILALGVYLMFALPRPNEAKEDVSPLDFSKLDEQEARVCNLLKEHEGSMYQSDLMKELNLSKVQMTRILDKLETRKIVERKRRGMTNIVVLR